MPKFDAIDQDILENIIRSSSGKALPHYGINCDGRKPDNSIITLADPNVEEFITTEIKKYSPGCGVIAEEGTRVTDENGLTFWIDPIDGTLQFDKGIAFWSISVGLFEKEIPIFGGVFAPTLNEYFQGSPEAALLNKKLFWSQAVKSTFEPSDMLCFPNSSHRRFTTDFPGKTTALGSIALEICYVACGRLIGTISSYINFWDIAGALPILFGAGGGAYLVETGEPLDIAQMLDCHKEKRLILYCRCGMQDLIRQHIHPLPLAL